MQIGVVFPSTDIGTDIAAIRDFAQAAEDLGYSHLLLPDHVLGAVHDGRDPPLSGPYDETTEFHEPFTLFSYLAGITSQIRFATGILILPQRQTALVAKQAAQLAILSGNRFRMGVGVGWNPVEYEALGESWPDRGARQEEQIELLRLLWSRQVVDYRGRWHRIDRAGLAPLPDRQIPIWLGGFKDVAHRRAARLADGFIMPGMKMSEVGPLMDRIRGYVTEAGRDPDAFGFEGAVSSHFAQDQWGRHVEAWRALGVSHIVMRAMTREGKSLPGPRDHIALLETYWREISG